MFGRLFGRQQDVRPTKPNAQVTRPELSKECEGRLSWLSAQRLMLCQPNDPVQCRRLAKAYLYEHDRCQEESGFKSNRANR